MSSSYTAANGDEPVKEVYDIVYDETYVEYKCEVGGDGGERTKGEWLVVKGCKCDNCEGRRKWAGLISDEQYEPLKTRAQREELREIKVVTAERVWNEWGWMRQQLLKDLLVIGGIGLASYTLLYKRTEVANAIMNCIK